MEDKKLDFTWDEIIEALMEDEEWEFPKEQRDAALSRLWNTLL
jgi:hypothetical protein